MKKLLMFGLVAILFASMGIVNAASPAYGAAGAAAVAEADLTLNSMLTFALEDEYLARGEYRKIMDKLGERRPFSNIIKAEEQHIAWLVPLLENHDTAIPADRGLELAQVPENFAEALQAGVTAETANIAMYERFLQRKLPHDVKTVFEHLLAASRNHLEAFQRSRGGGNNF